VTFASLSDKTAGEKIVTLVSFSDGVTTHRWSTDEIFDDTANVWYEPLILGMGPVDRVMDIGAPRESDLQIEVSNSEGQVDALFSDFSTFSPAAATATIKVGFASQSVSAFKTIATMGFSRVVGVSHDRVVTLEFIDDPERAMGEIVCFTNQEVYDALTVADNTTYPAVTGLTYGDRPVPIVLGRFMLTDQIDGVDAGPSLSSGTSLGGISFNGMVRMVAIGRYDFNTSRMRAIPLAADGSLRVDTSGRPGGTWDIDRTSFTGTLTWETVSVTLGGATWYVLVVKISNEISEDFGITSGGAWRFACEPYAPGRIIETDWRVSECVQAAVESAENFTSWAAMADAASWATVDAHTGTHLRTIITETMRAHDVLDRFLVQSGVDSYVNADGKIAGFWLVPTAGGSPDYSSEFQVTEEDDVLDMGAELSTEGRWSIANSVSAVYSDSSHFSGQFGDWVTIANRSTSGYSWTGDQTRRVSIGSTIVFEDADSISNHGRRYSISVGGPMLYNIDQATALARRELDLRADPRWYITVSIPWRAAQLELGSIVEFSHTAIPGWSADRACVVYAISYDPQAHLASVILVDFDAYLRGKVCLYDTMANWVVSDNADEAITINIANASSVITFSANGNWEDLETGDIFEIRTTANQFQGLIASMDSGAKTLTLASAGGEVGPLPATYSTENGVALWKVLRSQKNRGTLSTNYAVQDPKYGCYGGQDGFFEDDVEAAYTYQR